MFPWEDLRTPDECRQAGGWLIRDHLPDRQRRDGHYTGYYCTSLHPLLSVAGYRVLRNQQTGNDVRG